MGSRPKSLILSSSSRASIPALRRVAKLTKLTPIMIFTTTQLRHALYQHSTSHIGKHIPDPEDNTKCNPLCPVQHVLDDRNGRESVIRYDEAYRLRAYQCCKDGERQGRKSQAASNYRWLVYIWMLMDWCVRDFLDLMRKQTIPSVHFYVQRHSHSRDPGKAHPYTSRKQMVGCDWTWWWKRASASRRLAQIVKPLEQARTSKLSDQHAKY